MVETIIGRNEEIKQLHAFLTSKSSEFLAIYGRRRIGKTFLIKQFFQDKGIKCLAVSGAKNAPMREQMAHFTAGISNVFYQGVGLEVEKNWGKIFELLTKTIKHVVSKEKIVLFFDEFPWMVTPRSRLLQMLDYYWNQYWSNDKRAKLITCGSSASWIIDNIINNTGGLHNRITYYIRLEPFSLKEMQQFLHNRGIALNNRHVVELYMLMGGMPHYLKQIEKGMSATQIIEKLAFRRKGFLLEEFGHLFSSLFSNADVLIEFIKCIAEHRYGIGQAELFKKIGKESSGKGGLQKLNALIEAGFIMSFKPHWHKEKGIYYKVIDNYTLFYLTWILPVKDTLIKKSLLKGYWDKMKTTPKWHSWAGLTFEAICYEHLPQIMKSFSLSPTAIPNTWRYIPRKNTVDKGAQIDLLFDRDDDSITTCEIKYSEKPFVLTKEYAEKLENKLSIFKSKTRTKKQLSLVLISANGVVNNYYADELITSVATLEDLFNE